MLFGAITRPTPPFVFLKTTEQAVLLKIEVAEPLLNTSGYAELRLIFAALLRHGEMPLLVKILNLAATPYGEALAAPSLYLETIDWAENVSPVIRPQSFTLFDAASVCIGATEVAYCVRYNQLNRKLRKIVKNKYRYQKRFEWVPPALRARSAARLFKAYVKTRTELSFADRVAGAVIEQTLAPDTAPLTQLARQSQTSAVSALSQTTVTP